MVPEGTEPRDYGMGALLGPPDLSGLELPRKRLKALSNELVDRGLYSYSLLDGKRAELLRLLESFGFSKEEARTLRLTILAILQSDYLGG